MKIFMSSCVVLLGLLGLVSPNVQLAFSAEAAESPPHFEGLAPLVGKVWRGTFPDGNLHDTHEFEWMFGGKFLRNVHQVTKLTGEKVYEGETIYGWDHEAGTLRWWYFNATGGHVTGDLVESEGRWIAVGENNGPKGQTGAVRSEMIIGEDKWTTVTYFRDGEEWREQNSMDFEVLE